MRRSARRLGAGVEFTTGLALAHELAHAELGRLVVTSAEARTGAHLAAPAPCARRCASQPTLLFDIMKWSEQKKYVALRLEAPPWEGTNTLTFDESGNHVLGAPTGTSS